MKKQLRVGVIGCGNISRQHIAAYQAINGTTIVSVSDAHAPAAEATARDTGADVADSVTQMIRRDRPDIVSVCTPPATHLDVCRPLLRTGIAIYCEKPMEVNPQRAAKLADAVKRSRIPFMIGFGHRFHAPIIELKKLIIADKLGRILLMRNVFGGYSSQKGNHRSDPTVSGGGTLIDNTSHSIDLFRHLVGNPTRVTAVAANLMQRLRIEDFAAVRLDKAGKAFGELISGYALPHCENTVDLHGTDGMAKVTYWDPRHPELEYQSGRGKWKTVDCSKHPPSRCESAIRHFIGCVRRRHQPDITARDGVAASRIVAGAYQSAKTGKTIDLRMLYRSQELLADSGLLLADSHDQRMITP